MKLTIIVVLAMVALVAADGAFEGVWSSTRTGGGQLYICQEGSSQDPSSVISGMYGSVGYMEGTVSNFNVATGNWYDRLDSNCITGTFQITANGNQFAGTYTCGDESVQWIEERFTDTRPSQTECWTTSATSGSSLERQWANHEDRFYTSACVGGDVAGSNDTYTSSYFYPSDVQNCREMRGYSEGDCYLGGQLCTSTWYEGPYVFGQEIIRLLDDNTMQLRYFYGFTPDYALEEDFGEENYSQLDVEGRSNFPDDDDCTYNEGFKFDPTVPDQELANQNQCLIDNADSAATLAVSGVAIISVIAALVL